DVFHQEPVQVLRSSTTTMLTRLDTKIRVPGTGGTTPWIWTFWTTPPAHSDNECGDTARTGSPNPDPEDLWTQTRADRRPGGHSTVY
ncbi:unnamed protein product, partial [Boreogadus saida]